MPRASTRPEIVLALSQSQASKAFGVPVHRIVGACDAGLLIVRQLGNKRRIPVHGERGLLAWFDQWPLATRNRK